MSDPARNYAPRPLMMVREYPGYQFCATLRLEARSADDCFRYAALTIQNWLCERIRKAGGELPDDIACVRPADYMKLSTSALRGCRLPFSEIISMPGQGVWALVVREPAPDVAGRSFVTHVGLRLSDDVVEMGVRIDVVDGNLSLPEQDVVYRPQFIRLLFETDGMTVSQVEPLRFRRYIELADRRAVSRLKDLAENRANQLPIVVFTHVAAQEPDVADMQRLVEDVMKKKLMPAFDERRDAATPVLPRKEPACEVPYDAGEFSRHTYGFARVYVAMPGAFGELRARFGKARMSEGDILVVEPRAFGGAIWTIAFERGLNEAWYSDVTRELLEKLKRYSKHKPFDFGKALFIEDARQLLRDLELESLRALVHMEKNDELQQMLGQLECERETSAEQARRINELRSQMGDEYRRGEESERQRAGAIEAQLRSVRADNAELRKKIEAMSRSYDELLALREIAGRIQSVQSMPRTNEDVVSFFRLMFADRMDFTERGARTAARCDVKPETLWECLYVVATTLTDLYRDGVQEVEKIFKERTGWELATTEGMMTRKKSEYMNLRKDTYAGREISIEPHIKFSKSLRKTGAQYQRLHYAYDAASGRIIIGYVGDHLENHTSLSFH